MALFQNNNPNTLLLTLFIASLSLCSVAQKSESDAYSKIKVALSSMEDIQVLNDLQLDIDHYRSIEESTIEFIISYKDLKVLEAAGFSYEIIIPNYQEFYQNRAIEDEKVYPTISRTPRIADHFGYGSMGGFYTLKEIEEKLDTMSIDFPELATPKFSIGKSIEGRDIWAVKISDNPNISEEEDAVYYDALHHSREPLSMAVSINFAYWILENYKSNEQIKYLIDNRELYFVPCVNPDGFEYNRKNNPNGGGLWRKNRKQNSNCSGVDLNRNYSFGFANNNSCASNDPCSDTYRGPNAFSEPETKAIRDFLKLKKPKTAFSIHSTAGSCLMPYGYATTPIEFDIYSEWASDFLSENDYPYGVTYQMLGYTSCGTTRDYLHSEGIYGWTPEIDGSGFWPKKSEIFPLVDENVYPLLYQAWISGQYTDVQSHQTFGNAIPGYSFEMEVEVKNKGVGTAFSEVEVKIIPTSPLVQVSGDGKVGIVDARKKATTSPLTISIDPSFNSADVELKISVTQDGVEVDSEMITVPVGSKNVLFEDDAENGKLNWTSAGNKTPWGVIQDDSYDGNSSFGDSDKGNSKNNTSNTFTLNKNIDLSNAENPKLEFFTKWSLANGDGTTLKISKTNGSSWTNLKSYNKSEPWHQELFDLSAYVGSEIKIQFKLTTDGKLPADGFYFDKISITDYRSSVSNIPEFEETTISLYPNPANDFLKIVLSKPSKLNVELFDITGKKVKHFNIQKTTELDIKSLVPGAYFVKTLSLDSGKMGTDKFVKIE